KASSTTTVTSSVNPSVSGQTVTFTATVSAVAPGSGTPTGTVTFTIDGTPQAPVTMSGGVATISTSSFGAGAHTVTAAYSGDGNFNTSTSPNLTQTVSKDSATTSLVSSPNPSVFGQPVIFTATVAAVAPGAGTPSGTVTFKDGTNTLGSATLSGGQTTFTNSTLTTGSHTNVTAVYNGDGNFLTNISTNLTQTVNKADTTTVVSSAVNPSVFGQSVTFT